MRGLGGLLDCLDAQHHVVCPVCVPRGRGDCLCVFCALSSLLNVEGVYNELSLCLIVILVTSHLPSNQCLFGEALRGPPPCIR